MCLHATSKDWTGCPAGRAVKLTSRRCMDGTRQPLLRVPTTLDTPADLPQIRVELREKIQPIPFTGRVLSLHACLDLRCVQLVTSHHAETCVYVYVQTAVFARSMHAYRSMSSCACLLSRILGGTLGEEERRKPPVDLHLAPQ